MKILNLQIDAADPLFIYAHLDQLPYFKRKIAQGTSGIVWTYPGSAQAWTSFWTSEPPWIHGITDFWTTNGGSPRLHRILNDFIDAPARFLHHSQSPTKLAIKRAGLRLRTPLLPFARALRNAVQGQRRLHSRADIKLPTAYQRMTQHGLKVGLVGCVFTYPAWAQPGFVVSDWTMPQAAQDWYYPQTLCDWPELQAYKAALDRQRGEWAFLEGHVGEDPEKIYQDELAVLESVQALGVRLLGSAEWDFGALYFRWLDTVQHVFMGNEARLLEVYQIMDRTLAAVEAALAAGGLTDVCYLINSDHGQYYAWHDAVIRGG
ncbi:MAG: alkaline phosphatase family protein, partial [Anaerolineae bacterium]